MIKGAVTGLVVGALAFPVHRASAETAASELKQETTATLLSLGGTLAPMGILALGVRSENGPLVAAGVASALLAPSAGQLYAGEVLTVGMAIRAGALAAGVVGYDRFVDCIGEGSACRSARSSLALVAAGVIGYGIGALYDVATARSAVERHNRRVLQLAPIVPTTSAPAVGLSLGGSF